MKQDFHTRRIADIAEKVAMGPFGSNIKVETFVPAGVPIISGAHLRGFYLEEKDFNFITEEHAQRLKNSIVYPGDIVFTHAGNVGQVAMIPYDCQYPFYMISQRQFYLRCDKKKVLLEYLVYYFHSHEGQGKLLSNVSQVGVPSIAQPSSFLKTIEIPLPSLETQRRIVGILDSFTKKIEVNNQINRNLEEQIQALYRFYFEGNEKGTITHGKLKDICFYVTEKTSVSELTLDNYFSTENLLADKRGATKASGLPQTALTTKCVSGNTLVSNIRPYFKKLLFCDKAGGCSTDVLCFQAKTPQLTNFLYSTLYFDAFFDYMTAGSKGTKMPRGDKAQIMEYPIPIPAPDLLAEFNQKVTPMIKLCQKCKQENTVLSQTRDTLLPKLILDRPTHFRRQYE